MLKKIKVGCWQDAAFALMLLYGLFSNYALLSELRQLPSPVYGGDYYHHLGMMYHLDRGGSIFENSAQKGEIPWIPPLYHYLVVLFARVTGLGLIGANIYSSLLFLVIGMGAVYAFSKRMFHNATIALVPAVIYLFRFPIYKYSNFAMFVTIPIALYLLLDAFEKNSLKNWALAGFGIGLVEISHTMAGLVFAVVMFVVVAYLVVFKHVCLNPLGLSKKGVVETIRKDWFKLFAFIAIAGLIAQLYWFQPIFLKKLATPNMMSEYDQVDIKSIGPVKYALSTAKGWLLGFDFTPSASALVSDLQVVLFDLGLLALLFVKKREPRHTFALLMFAAFLLSYYHFVVTIPLFGREFFSAHMYDYLMEALRPLLIGFGLLLASAFVTDKKIWRAFVLIFIAGLFLNTAYSFNISARADKWYQVGTQPLAPYTVALAEWVQQNTGVEDVFISTNEHAFMLNALTGNKVVNLRRGHSGMYTDVDQRWVDSAVILYGNNSKVREELIKKYDVKYLYWQADWIQLDYTFDQNGRLVGWFDPLLIQDINGYGKYLEDNGVKFYRINTWLDPTRRFTSDVQTFDVLFVIPSRWNATNPWNPGLDSRIVKKKDLVYGGEIIGTVYAIS